MSTNIRTGFGFLAIAAAALALGGCGGGGGSTAGATTGTASAETVLHSFTDTPDGSSPSDWSGLVQASDHYLYGMTNNGGQTGNGAVIKISTSGQESVLHSFGVTAGDGFTAESGLIQASDGYLYGVTLNGGAHNKGAVIKVSTTGQESVLYSFGSIAGDGTQPVGNLLEVGGNLYGVTASGGANGGGTVFELTTAGVETPLYSFAPTAGDGGSPADGLVLASDGKLYGLANAGGAYAYGAVFSYDTSTGTEALVYSFGTHAWDGGSNATPTGRLIQGSDGALYGALQGGGAYGFGAIFKVTTSGVESIVHSFSGSPGDGSTPFGGVVQLSDGYFYGVTAYGGANYKGVAYKVNALGTERILYDFGTTTSDAASPAGNLIQASDGHLYGMSATGGTKNLGTVFRVN